MTTRIMRHTYEYVLAYRSSPFTFSAIPTSTAIPLEIWDCPGNITPETLEGQLSQFSALIFVIDIQVRISSPTYPHWRLLMKLSSPESATGAHRETGGLGRSGVPIQPAHKPRGVRAQSRRADRRLQVGCV